MSLKTFTTQQIVQFGPWKKERAVVVKSGELQIYIKNDDSLDDSDDDSWTLDSSSYGVDTHFIKTTNLKIKFDPTDGTSYAIDLNEEM